MNNTQIRQLKAEEPIPYELLLLADETIESIDKYIHDSKIFLLEFENKPIGVYALQEIEEKAVEIKNIAVAEKLQGQGFGKFMLNHASENAKEKGYESIWIGTGDAGIMQLYLYQKMGFEMSEIKKNFFIDNFPEPIYENGIQLKHMIMLRKGLI